MAIEIVVVELAKQDIIEIVDYYNSKQEGLGEKFYTELLSNFEKIKQRLTGYTSSKNNFQKFVLKKFPYLIIFKLTEKEIIIYAILYGGRDPQLFTYRTSQ